MELIIENCDDMDFIQFLKDYFIKWVKANMERSKLTKLDKNLQEITENKKLFCAQIIITALNTLQVSKDTTGTLYTISINKVKKYQGSDLLIYDLIKYINYGNLEVQGYPIIKRGFEQISENLESLEVLYKYGRV